MEAEEKVREAHVTGGEEHLGSQMAGESKGAAERRDGIKKRENGVLKVSGRQES